eukprot:TRINITY_DN3564_c0_g1_i3.p1 TRINITY_DN3564_c0_g1~~TRINITY_DN3564_c0_g1_i3.p1  ORF type:complete len:394 (+),score=63.80 TRINITY_DN3564_c0_g1_i3:708-1889(+)
MYNASNNNNQAYFNRNSTPPVAAAGSSASRSRNSAIYPTGNHPNALRGPQQQRQRIFNPRESQMDIETDAYDPSQFRRAATGPVKPPSNNSTNNNDAYPPNNGQAHHRRSYQNLYGHDQRTTQPPPYQARYNQGQYNIPQATQHQARQDYNSYADPRNQYQHHQGHHEYYSQGGPHSQPQFYSTNEQRRTNHNNNNHPGQMPGFMFGPGGMTEMFAEMDNLFQDVFGHPFFTGGRGGGGGGGRGAFPGGFMGSGFPFSGNGFSVNLGSFLNLIPGMVFAGGPAPQQDERGLDREEINSFPTSKFKKEEPQRPGTRGAQKKAQASEQKCIICLCDFEDGDTVRTLTCLHQFHPQCIDQWLEQKGQCPVCRNDFTNNNQQNTTKPINVHNELMCV